MLSAFLATTLLLSLELERTAVWSASTKLKKDFMTSQRASTPLAETSDARPGKSLLVTRGMTTADIGPYGTSNINYKSHQIPTFRSYRLHVTNYLSDVLNKPTAVHKQPQLFKLATIDGIVRVGDEDTLIKSDPKTFRNNLLAVKTPETLQAVSVVPRQRLKRDTSIITAHCGPLTEARCRPISARTCVSMCVNNAMVQVCRTRTGCGIRRNVP